MKRWKLFLVAALVSSSIYAQNRAEFFKAIPKLTADTPAWAQLMYSEDPNVAEVIKTNH